MRENIPVWGLNEKKDVAFDGYLQVLFFLATIIIISWFPKSKKITLDIYRCQSRQHNFCLRQNWVPVTQIHTIWK